jgi:hypothetical protein
VKNDNQGREREINERALRGQFANYLKALPVNLKSNVGLAEACASIKYELTHLKHVGSELPKTWIKVREDLEQDARNHISVDEYFATCEKHGFKELGDRLQLSGYLHDLGVFLHFQEDPLPKKDSHSQAEMGHRCSLQGAR